MENSEPENNKFHKGNSKDGKHYWLTPPDFIAELKAAWKESTEPLYRKVMQFIGLFFKS